MSLDLTNETKKTELTAQFEEAAKNELARNYGLSPEIANTLPTPTQMVSAYKMCANNLFESVKKRAREIEAVSAAVTRNPAGIHSLEGVDLPIEARVRDVISLYGLARDIENGMTSEKDSDAYEKARSTYNWVVASTVLEIRRGNKYISGMLRNGGYSGYRSPGWHYNLGDFLPSETLAPFPNEPARIESEATNVSKTWRDRIRHVLCG